MQNELVNIFNKSYLLIYNTLERPAYLKISIPDQASAIENATSSTAVLHSATKVAEKST
ncbi:hypothetical protein [Pedobacter gandavensis]|uniref:Uncharacterized protein n=1 Tax=Pedobacter gandavensis TaxID=2679963 RepID=A0ABR6EW80_9SPHI|nr:hypothetical protein [Pedobacter gandavensis]MBB2149441.1 hypothetical protein [Pedobacter gandavensis]